MFAKHDDVRLDFDESRSIVTLTVCSYLQIISHNPTYGKFKFLHAIASIVYSPQIVCILQFAFAISLEVFLVAQSVPRFRNERCQFLGIHFV